MRYYQSISKRAVNAAAEVLDGASVSYQVVSNGNRLAVFGGCSERVWQQALDAACLVMDQLSVK